jgi:predicted glycoside hydrolase/deacetylase ChbG (UPF0249 family)
VLTSTSLMAGQPASEYALSQIARIPDVSVGLHVNLCEGHPILPAKEVPTLVDTTGRFHSFSEMASRLWRFKVSSQELEAEITAQIRWMKDRGAVPTHADSHQHLHNYPATAAPYRRSLLAEGITRSRAPRHQYWPKDGMFSSAHAGSILRKAAAGTYMRGLQTLGFHGITCPDSCVVYHPRFRTKPQNLFAAWTSIFNCMPPGTYEMGCHPGFRTDGFSARDPICEKRVQEIEMLIDPAFRQCIETNEIDLISYMELTNGHVTDHLSGTISA